MKVQMTLQVTISVAMPVGRDKKIRTALRTHQIAGFVSVPSKKKINTPYSGCEFIFFRALKRWEKIWAKFPLVSDVKLSNNWFIILLLFSVISVLILVCELHPTALSVFLIGRIRCSFLLKSLLLWQSNFKKIKQKIKIWIVQGGQYVATYFWLVLKCNTVAYIAVFITLFDKMTQQWNDKAP